MEKNKSIRKIIFLICIVLNCATIFYFSSQVAEKSTGTSSRVVSLLSEWIPAIKQMPEPEKAKFQKEVMQPVVRKMAHFSIYALLGIVTMNYALTFKRSFYQRGLASLGFGIFYAITDEFHQLFTLGRCAEVRDVLIDSLGMLTGILFVVLCTKLYRKIRKKEEKQSFSKQTKVLFISSTGGHFSELMQLKPLMEKCNYQIVTEKTKSNSNLKETYQNKIHFLRYGTKKTPFSYCFILLANCFISLGLYLKQRPQIVITTGTHTAGPMCCIARILGSKVIYIETYANRTTKTHAGRLLYYVANTFVVQWEEMLDLYPKAKYFGSIY